MNPFQDDRRHPSGGEHVTHAAGAAIRLAHKVLERFPDVVRRHKYIAGGAAVSTSLVTLAGVAIARRMRGGQSEEEAVASVTEDELAGFRVALDDPEGDAGYEAGDADPEAPSASEASSAGGDGAVPAPRR